MHSGGVGVVGLRWQGSVGHNGSPALSGSSVLQASARRAMTISPKRTDADWPRLFLRRTDQAVAAVITAGSLIAIAGWFWWQTHLGGRLIDIERAEPVAIDFKIDV